MKVRDLIVMLLDYDLDSEVKFGVEGRLEDITSVHESVPENQGPVERQRAETAGYDQLDRKLLATPLVTLKRTP